VFFDNVECFDKKVIIRYALRYFQFFADSVSASSYIFVTGHNDLTLTTS